MSSKITYGVILGCLGGLLSIFYYILGPESMLNLSWLSYVMWAVMIGLLIFFGTKLRAENGGYFTFGQAYGALMMMIVVSTVVGSIFSFILFNVIDTEFGVAYFDLMAQQLYDQGLPEEQVEMTMEITKKMNPFKPLGLAIAALVSVVFYAVINLVLAAIIKRNPPENFLGKEGDDVLV